MKMKKFLPYLILLIATAFLTGCPVDEDDLFGGKITITNSELVTMDEIAIDDDCTSSWDGIAATSLLTGATGVYDVSGSIAVSTYDVRVCDVVGNSCFIWLTLGPGDETVDTATADSQNVARVGNC